MNHLIHILRKAEKLARDNSPAILTALGVSGTVTTAYLAAKAAYSSVTIIKDEEERQTEKNQNAERAIDRSWVAVSLTTKEKAHLVWELYIPAGISGIATIGCIIAATKVGSRRTAAITAAYSLSEKAFVEYKDKVIEKFGENKESALRDEIAQDRVSQASPQGVIVAGVGSVLCYEMFTGRYFSSDMETLRKAQNDINAKLVRELYVTLSDFYYMIGLPFTAYSSEIGWESGKFLDLEFSTVLSEDSKPCIAFNYNYTKPL